MHESPSVDTRWSSLDAMPAEEWNLIAARVAICLDCRGPALLTNEQLPEVITQPMCTRCRRTAEVA